MVLTTLRHSQNAEKYSLKTMGLNGTMDIENKTMGAFYCSLKTTQNLLPSCNGNYN